MSDKGEWIDDWEQCEEDDICDCGERLMQRLWRRNDGREMILRKCFECGDSSWVDA